MGFKLKLPKPFFSVGSLKTVYRGYGSLRQGQTYRFMGLGWLMAFCLRILGGGGCFSLKCC